MFQKAAHRTSPGSSSLLFSVIVNFLNFGVRQSAIVNPEFVDVPAEGIVVASGPFSSTADHRIRGGVGPQPHAAKSLPKYSVDIKRCAAAGGYESDVCPDIERWCIAE